MEREKLRRCGICHNKRVCKEYFDDSSDISNCLVCESCLSNLLHNIVEPQIAKYYCEAQLIAKVHDISMPYAINAATGVYTLKEAKRRDRLKKRELDGYSSDAYNLGKRSSGSFGGGKRR